MTQTTIEWTDHSISPVRACNKATGKVFHFCEKISPGCAHCYAESLALRFGLYEYQQRNRDKVELFLDESKLKEVLRRRKPTKYFWEDCSDLFGDWVPFDWIDKCFAVMALTPHHTHQILTKRPERMAEYLKWPLVEHPQIGLIAAQLAGSPCAAAAIEDRDWPLPNVWLGTSVENQQTADERIPHLLKCPAAVRFLSCEPLLSAIDFRRRCHAANCTGECGWPSPFDLLGDNEHGSGALIDWIIVGGESGRGARPCRPEWVRSIVRQCKAAGVSCFVKQLGGNVVTRNDMVEDAFNGREGWPDPHVEHHIHGFREDYQGADCRIRLQDSKGGDPSEWPADLRVRQMPI